MGFFDWSTPNREVATAVQRAAAAARFPPASGRGPSTGVLYKVTDGNPTPFPGCLEFAQPDFEAAYAQKLRDDQQLGAEYVTFQVFLPPRYLNTGGMYRNDDAFLTLCADRIAMLQRVAHSLGMNCYIEVHPAARPLPSRPWADACRVLLSDAHRSDQRGLAGFQHDHRPLPRALRAQR